LCPFAEQETLDRTGTMAFHHLLPDVEALLALEPEELAGLVLQYLAKPETSNSELLAYNFTLGSNVEIYPEGRRDEAKRALMEAWVWLEREGLLAPRPGDNNGWVFVTRRGRQLANPAALKEYRHANLLPKQQLHPVIAQKVWATFLRGDFDTAVFQSFKELEVRTREAANLALSDLGVDLMRKAFKPSTGPLSNRDALVAEQEALMHLMAGAIGSYKNPNSHRNVQIEAPEAVEMIVLASHLLRIIDSAGG